MSVDQCVRSVRFGAHPAQHRVSFHFKLKMIQSRYLARHESRKKIQTNKNWGNRDPGEKIETAQGMELSG